MLSLKLRNWFSPLALLAGAYGCSASTDADSNLTPGGGACKAANDCQSGVCNSGVCVGNAGVGGLGAVGAGVGGAGASLGGNNSGSNGGTGSRSFGTGVAPFHGDSNYTPLTPGCGPETAHDCVPCNHPGGSGDATAVVIRPPTFLCFAADSSKKVTDPTPDDPAALIEQVVETLNGKSYVHIRVTFDPAFVDNTYGVNANSGWPSKRGHTFVDDLTGSDHIDLLLTDGTGKTVMELGEDYISGLKDTKPGGPGAGPGAGPGSGPGPKDRNTGGTTSVSTSTSTAVTEGCGYRTLGVSGGDGYMTTGSASYVIGVATSQDRNLACGYCQSTACSSDGSLGDCTVNSPKTDDVYTPNPQTPKWNFDVVYEVWIDTAAFGSAGFGQAYIEYVHASPSKASSDTLYVLPTACPPGIGHCTSGQDCWVPSTGTTPQSDAGVGSCEQNYQVYVTADGHSSCTPIPFAGYSNHDACPSGYTLDTASEGRYCLPSH